MHWLFPFVMAIAYVTPLAAEPASLWTHNGSIVGLYADGPARAFRYQEPRPALRAFGVAEGTLLFEGERFGDSYAGVAYVFSSRCGAVPYPVNGAPAADERSLMLYGVAPAGFDAQCRAITFREDVLRFDLWRVLTPPAEPAVVASAPDIPLAVPEPQPAIAPPPTEAPQLATASIIAPPPAVASAEPYSYYRAPPGAPLLPLLAVLLCIAAIVYFSVADASRVPKATSAPAPSPSPPSLPDHQPPPPTPQRPPMTTNTALVQVPDVPPVPSIDKIFLKLRRSQRATMLAGKPVFILDARAELTPELRALVGKYRLGELVVYDSKARKQSTEAAYAHFGEAATSSVGRSLWKNARGLASAAMMALTLRVTVDKLIAGQHIECKDLDELLGAESAFVEACKNLRTYLDVALSFDGREELLEF